ncbi:MAG TPA: hypothetical protein VGO93_10685 [Candidatus Xenobia bacterium]
MFGNEGRDNARCVTVPAELVQDVAAGIGEHGVHAALMADANGGVRSSTSSGSVDLPAPDWDKMMPAMGRSSLREMPIK